MTDVFAGLVLVMVIVGTLDAVLRQVASSRGRWRPVPQGECSGEPACHRTRCRRSTLTIKTSPIAWSMPRRLLRRELDRSMRR